MNRLQQRGMRLVLIVVVAIGFLVLPAARPSRAASGCSLPNGKVIYTAPTGESICFVAPPSPPLVGPAPAAPLPPVNHRGQAPTMERPEPPVAALPVDHPDVSTSMGTGLLPPPGGHLVSADGSISNGPPTTFPLPPVPPSPPTPSVPPTLTPSPTPSPTSVPGAAAMERAPFGRLSYRRTGGTGLNGADPTGGNVVRDQANTCYGTTPKAYFTTNPFNWSEEMSLVVEQQGTCYQPTYFYYLQSTNGGQSYQEFYGGTTNQLAMSFGNFPTGTQFDYAVLACDSYCSNYGYMIAFENGPGQSQYSYSNGVPWYYQNYGFANNGGGYTGQGISSSPSGADRYLSILQTPQSGANLTYLTDAFAYIGGYTNDAIFYQVGYSQSASRGFSWFAATTYSLQSYTVISNSPRKIMWNGVSCPAGEERQDFDQGTVRGVTVRCDLYSTAPNTQQTYDVHVYTNMVYVGLNGSALMNVADTNNGYVYRAHAVDEMVGGAASPQTTLGYPSPTRGPGYMVESWFTFLGQYLGDIVNDYYVSTDVFSDALNTTTSPTCGYLNIGAVQRETVLRPWDVHWDTGEPDC